MKLSIKSVLDVLRRYSVSAGVLGGTITAASTQLTTTLAAVGMHLPDKMQGDITLAAASLTAVSVLGAALIPQATVATYNPQTHDVTPKTPESADAQAVK